MSTSLYSNRSTVQDAFQIQQTSAHLSKSVLGYVKQRLMQYSPFSEIPSDQIDFLIQDCVEFYFSPNEVVIPPYSQVQNNLFFLETGTIMACKQQGELPLNGVHYQAGSLLPVSAFIEKRAVTSSYVAQDDCFCLLFSRESVERLCHISKDFDDFLHRRAQQFLTLSQRSAQLYYLVKLYSLKRSEQPIFEVMRTQVHTCQVHDTLEKVIHQIKTTNDFPLVILNEQKFPVGLITLSEFTEKVTLQQQPKESLVTDVFSAPCYALDHQSLRIDAMLLMTQFGVGDIPVLKQNQLVGLLREQDVFFTQSGLSLRSIYLQIQTASQLDALRQIKQSLYELAQHLLALDLKPSSLIRVMTQFNNTYLQRIIEFVADKMGCDPLQYCWLSLGCEGRSENSLPFSQCNALVFVSDQPHLDRLRWLSFAKEVNDILSTCGFLVSKQGIVASHKQYCLTVQEWLAQFQKWESQFDLHALHTMKQFIDLKPTFGNESLYTAIQQSMVLHLNRSNLITEGLIHHLIDSDHLSRLQDQVDQCDLSGQLWLEIQNTCLRFFIDAARLFALKKQITSNQTRERFRFYAECSDIESVRSDTWINAFDYLQMLRLRTLIEKGQLYYLGSDSSAVGYYQKLCSTDRRIIKECLKVAYRLSQRIKLEQFN